MRRTGGSACRWAALAAAMAFGGAAMGQAETPGKGKCEWYDRDALARELCQLTPHEIAKFRSSALLDARPAVLPRPERVVDDNDTFCWPAAVTVNKTIVVLYNRRLYHFGRKAGSVANRNASSGTRMVVCTHDGGGTWSRPFDLWSAGKWAKSPLGMWGGAIGLHEGKVYILLREGLYVSADEGRTWTFAVADPNFGDVPPSRVASLLCFDKSPGLILWTTEQFAGDRLPHYGRKLRAVYSPDFGRTWKWQEQAIPDDIPTDKMSFCELTPLRLHDGRTILFNRNRRNGTFGTFAQVWSATGWFPFRFALTNVYGWTDTPGIIYNPLTKRIEASVSHRKGKGDGPGGGMKVNLYSIDPDDVFVRNAAAWRYEGTLVRYKHVFGENNCDGINPMSNVVLDGRHHVFCWAGNAAGADGQAGIFQYTRSLDTPAVREYLIGFYKRRE